MQVPALQSPRESRRNLLGQSTLPCLTCTDPGSQFLLILLFNRELLFNLLVTSLVGCGLFGESHSLQKPQYAADTGSSLLSASSCSTREWEDLG